jgi:hypothetical protein
MPFTFCPRLTLSVLLFFPVVPGIAQGQSPLFDGKTFAGWEGDTNQTWRVEAGAITARSPDQPAPRNEFLATVREFTNLGLRMKFRIQGSGVLNAGVQFAPNGFRNLTGMTLDKLPDLIRSLPELDQPSFAR